MWAAFSSALRKSEIVLYGVVAGAATVVVTVPAMLLLGGVATTFLTTTCHGTDPETSGRH